MINNHRYCVIMCGGIGSRFWPYSRTNRPKQFIDFLGTGRTLLQMSYDRVLPFVPKENVIIATAHTDTKMIDNVYLHETVSDRGQRLVESYREIKESHFFFVEQETRKKLRNHNNKIITLITNFLTKIIKILNKQQEG